MKQHYEATWPHNLDLRHVLHSAPMGAGGPNQNTSRIQHIVWKKVTLILFMIRCRAAGVVESVVLTQADIGKTVGSSAVVPF